MLALRCAFKEYVLKLYGLHIIGVFGEDTMKQYPAFLDSSSVCQASSISLLVHSCFVSVSEAVLKLR